MPELKHTFTSGRMNKDLDERLVPNGEYRDALNIEVSTSEGSDMGAIQTTMGNINLSQQDMGLLPGGFCVGSIADEKNDKLYWLIASNDKDIIAEYDYNTGVTKPVLVDTHATNSFPRVLNFNANNYITGINIIDDMLFWTDNLSEPKHINITRCKAGSSGFNIHTNFLTTNPWSSTQALWSGVSGNPIPITEEHITVIKKSPKLAPSLEMKNTLEGKIGGIISDKDFTDNGALPNVAASPPPTTIIELDATDYNYEIGDILLLTTVNNNADELQVRVKVSVVNPSGGNAAEFEVIILSIDTNILSIDTFWEVELEQKDALFQFKFPRFACRYKYEDGEYSAFSPFTEIAFLPKGGEFDYLPKKGFNLSMVNDIRYLAVKDFVPEEDLLPDGVVEIDILYKESNSPNIYSVKTLTRDLDEWNIRSGLTSSTASKIYNSNDAGWSSNFPPSTGAWNFSAGPGYRGVKGYIKVTSEMIHAVLPSNQLLRPWDNVPRNALAQEVSGNRLIYGNYLQNYNVPHPSIEVGVWSQSMDDSSNFSPEQIFPANAYKYFPAKSIKSLRTYQLGVVYIDKYGRETPVFSEDDNNNSSVTLDKWHANRQNRLQAKIITPPPSWAKSFKYFIKEASNEYYNLAVDRWYDAEDDNVWLSFPSSERNKVDEDTFLILKKQHDSSGFVTEDARYKILAIDNEAPTYIKSTIKSFGEIADGTNSNYFADGGGVGFPLVDHSFMWVDKTPWEDQGWDETLVDKNNLYLRVSNANTKSQWYAIANISSNSQSGSHYQITLEDSFKNDISFTSTNNSYSSRVGGLEIEIMQRIEENKPEFDGRFFVKIHKDLTLKERLIGQNNDNKYYVIKLARASTYINSRSTYNHSGTYDYTEQGGSIRKNNAWHGWGRDKFDIEWFNINGFSGDGFLYWDKVKKSSGDPWRGSWFIDGQQGFVDHYSSTSILLGEPISPGTALDFASPTSVGAWYTSGAANQAGYKDGATHVGAPAYVTRDGDRINLSFSGVGQTYDMSGHYDWSSHYIGPSKTGNVNANNIVKAFLLENWNYYVSELLFINTLTNSGTLWRWAADPDKIVYKTQGATWSDFIFNYTTGYLHSLATFSSLYLACGGIWGVGAFGNCGQDSLRRLRYNFYAKSLLTFQNPGVEGEQGYLPTNPPNWVYEAGKTHQIREYDSGGNLVQVDLRPRPDMSQPDSSTNTNDGTYIGMNHPLYKIDEAFLTNGLSNPNYVPGMETTSMALNNPFGYAPGIRHDGMNNGAVAPAYTNDVSIGSDGHYSGSVIWQILEEKDPADIKYSSHNPAIFETEPKENIGLDIYHEIGQEYPITLDGSTNEQYIPLGAAVTAWKTNLSINAVFGVDVRVTGHNDDTVTLEDNNAVFTANGPNGIDAGDVLFFTRADGSATSATVNSIQGNGVYKLNSNLWQNKVYLPWFNCYSFGNGVESDRIRDDYNQVTIGNGPKASATLDEPYKEERRSSGLIYSGIYNSQSGVNNLNQFIQAEKITKDLNPTYGSIQKLYSRDTNLVTLCEDKILKVLANKDALYNADGSVNLTATENVLGQTTPFLGEYGISKNPESFAVDSYRMYFTDKTRGAVLRMSQDGITPISSNGMKDWFSDNLRTASKLVGSVDDKKESYNITLRDRDNNEPSTTVTFTENAKGWSSFKSFIQDGGLSLNDSYYTFEFGQLWEHHVNQIRNSFYDSIYNSHVEVLFNEQPGSVKSFNTLNYEGSQAKITPDVNNDVDFYNNFLKMGWYVDEIYTNLQNGKTLEFKDKEGKWFSQIKGEATEWLDDGKAGNIDTQEFSYQGIGNADIDCPTCPTSWQCISSSQTTSTCDGLTPVIPPTQFSTPTDFVMYVSDPINGLTSSPANSIYSCIDFQPNNSVDGPPDCNCGKNGVEVLGFSISFTHPTNTFTGQVGIFTTYHNTWDDFLSTMITAGYPLTSGMTFVQVIAALNIHFANNNIQSKPQIDIGEVTLCQCTTSSVCNCIETYGNQGYSSQADCEAAANCCGSGSVGCLPCSDPNADTSVPGCCNGDGTQTNYNPLATCDDGSCIPIVYGCTDPNATNYYTAATIDDGSCIYGGCTDPTATNYNPLATIDDGSCIYGPNPVLGCIDTTAINYNPLATQDDGSCIYPAAACVPHGFDSNFNNFCCCPSGSTNATLSPIPLNPAAGQAGYTVNVVDDTGNCASPNNDGSITWSVTMSNWSTGPNTAGGLDPNGNSLNNVTTDRWEWELTSGTDGTGPVIDSSAGAFPPPWLITTQTANGSSTSLPPGPYTLKVHHRLMTHGHWTTSTTFYYEYCTYYATFCVGCQ